VIDLATHPADCPDLGRHAVYLGEPGPDPSCPPDLLGKTENAWIHHATPASPDSIQATRQVHAGGRPARVNPDQAVTHTITEILPAAGAEVSLSYGTDPALAHRIQSTVRIQLGDHAVTKPGGRAWNFAGPVAEKLPAAAPAQSLYQGAGFDTCGAPAASTMTAWLASPYRAIGIYIGGLNRGCGQANLTAAWITAIQQQGWHYFPFYVGLQASCVLGQHDASITASKAAAQGNAAAVDAAAQAAALGIPKGTPIIYDMEAYSGCTSEVVKFLSSWDAGLHTEGYQAGIYESFSNVGDLVKASATMTEPDVLHYADWDGKATTASTYMPAAMWVTHQRIHQYQGGHNEKWGGVTLDIDNDQLDAVLGGTAVTAAKRTAFRPAVGLDAGRYPDWLARAANHTLVHDSQLASGSWSGVIPLGTSPTNIASNPAVTAEANGTLTVAARTSAGQIVHAWQQASAPGNWKWGGSIPAAGSPGTVTGDPGVGRRPAGEVEVFVTTTGGAVGTTHQTAVNNNRTWSAWISIGGSCASPPVPFTTAQHVLEVFCRTKAGKAAVSRWTGHAWTAWRSVGTSPAGLAATPAVVADAAGQTELFATTTAGVLDTAWQNPRTGHWTWTAPLAGTAVARSPAAIRWPDGDVRVFAHLSTGALGYASQLGSSAASGWSAWTSAGGSILGSPAVWVSASGTPGAGALSPSLTVATTSYGSGAWTSWTELGGSF
jgi:hypothetical protein